VSAPYTFDDSEAAWNYLIETHKARRQGQHVTADKRKIKFKDFAPKWQDSLGTTQRDSTVKGYKCICEKHLVPYFGEKRIVEISPLDVKTFLRKMKKADGTPVGRGTQYNAKAVLSMMMNEAISEGYAHTNPADGITIGGGEDEEMIFLEREEVDRIVQCLHPRFHLAVYIAAYCGLRAEELWALRWRHVDQVNGRLLVETQGKKVERQSDNKPKAGKRRDVAVPTELMERLVAAMKGKSLDDYITVTRQGKRVNQNNFYARHWIPAVTKAGVFRVIDGKTKLPRFHDLRHSCAGFYFANGTSPELVRRVLGHASLNTTQRYAHFFPRAFTEAIDALEVKLPDIVIPWDVRGNTGGI
jgi:integrase